MTQERINAIAEMLNADEARMQKLMEMDADQAAEAMKAEGYDFTAEELIEFNRLMTDVVKTEDDEAKVLDEKSLDEVAGGCGYYGYYYYYYHYPRYYHHHHHHHCHWY